MFAEWTHPFPAAQSQIVFSLVLNFSVARTTTAPLAGPGMLGHALGRVQAGDSGGKHISSDDSGNHTLPLPLLLCRRWSAHGSPSPLLPSPTMWLNSAGLGTVVRCEKHWQSLAPVHLRSSHANVLQKIAKWLLEMVFCPYFHHF